jgi:hypothetical protein
MQCCGTTQLGTQCSRKTSSSYCHQHDQKETCAVIEDATLDKIVKLLKNNPYLTDLELSSNLDCNCKLLLKPTEFRNLEFLSITLANFCDKDDYSLWSKFKNLLYLDLNLNFKSPEGLFHIINSIPNLAHLVISDLKTLIVPNLSVPSSLHTLVLKGSLTEPHNFDLSRFLHLKRLSTTRSDYGLGKFLKKGFQFQHLIVLEIGGLIFEELNTPDDLQYLPTTLRYLKIKHILYPDLLKSYLLSLPNLEYLDLQDSFSLNKIVDIIPQLTNLQGIYVNTINFADLSELTLKALQSAKFRQNWLSFDFSYSDLLKYNQSEHSNVADDIGNSNWHLIKELFHLSDSTVNPKGWEILNTRNNTPQQWLLENEFIVKDVCKCKL